MEDEHENIGAQQKSDTTSTQPQGQGPFKVVTIGPDGERVTTGEDVPVRMSDAVARHQPPVEPVDREFADHLDRARQSVKDWVRKEIGLLVQGKSHDERVAENP